jgi:hypothetical protein
MNSFKVGGIVKDSPPISGRPSAENITTDALRFIAWMRNCLYNKVYDEVFRLITIGENGCDSIKFFENLREYSKAKREILEIMQNPQEEPQKTPRTVYYEVAIIPQYNPNPWSDEPNVNVKYKPCIHLTNEAEIFIDCPIQDFPPELLRDLLNDFYGK